MTAERLGDRQNQRQQLTTCALHETRTNRANKRRNRYTRNMRSCENCGTLIVTKRAHARFCSDKCRIYWRRKQARDNIPTELKQRARWIRHTADKRPITTTGEPASSTNPATWTDYETAKQSTAGTGLGFTLTGDGISCIDIDHCITDGQIDHRAIEYALAANPFYIETSPSGDGIHAWTHTPSPGRNRWTLDNGLAVEWYDSGRYMTVTGKQINL